MLQPICQHGSKICVMRAIFRIGTIVLSVKDFIHEIWDTSNNPRFSMKAVTARCA